MNLDSFSALWAHRAALGDHLWQSTLVVGVAGMLTQLFRNNRARVRYWLWFAASLKFLIPFSLLTGIGSHLMSFGVAPATMARLRVAREINQPFTDAFSRVNSPLSAQAGSPAASQSLPNLALGVWFCGAIAIVAIWCFRWRRVSATARQAKRPLAGREIEALRRAERLLGVRRPINLSLTPAPIEPCVVGIVKPVLLLPESVSERLSAAQLEAIVAHEVCHVRRRDNLAAFANMLVQTIFWFHPLVWWLGTRLLEERELACDEGALEVFHDRYVYAESILRTCTQCLGLQLACASGVTGLDLKKRIIRIMTARTCKVNSGKQLLLVAAGLATIGVPLAFGTLKATPAGRDRSGLASLLHIARTPSDTGAVRKAVAPKPQTGSPKKKVCLKSAHAAQKMSSAER